MIAQSFSWPALGWRTRSFACPTFTTFSISQETMKYFHSFLIGAIPCIVCPMLLAQSIGTKIWEFQTGDAIYSSPALGADGTIYIGSADNKVYALDSNGAKKWE